jgi:hypothetical protein
VGLGGYSTSATHLEQAGTEADCATDGVAKYSVWYELVPRAPVTLKLTITAGDAVAVTVVVKGSYVSVLVRDRTRGTSIRKRIHFAGSDTSSAEWITEAPSECNSAGNCTTLPLTDFGAATFSQATAATRAGHSETIVSSDCSSQPIELQQALVASGDGRFFGPRELVTAAPTITTAAGASFSVSWDEQRGCPVFCVGGVSRVVGLRSGF